MSTLRKRLFGTRNKVVDEAPVAPAVVRRPAPVRPKPAAEARLERQRDGVAETLNGLMYSLRMTQDAKVVQAVSRARKRMREVLGDDYETLQHRRGNGDVSSVEV